MDLAVRSSLRVTARRPRPSGEGESAASTIVPQAWHSAQRPAHFGVVQPHSVQRKFDWTLAMLDSLSEAAVTVVRPVIACGRDHSIDEGEERGCPDPVAAIVGVEEVDRHSVESVKRSTLTTGSRV